MYKKTILFSLILIIGFIFTFYNSFARFVIGGALLNLGYFFQDGIQKFDFLHNDDITPQQIWEELLKQNQLSSNVRKKFPRASIHPLIGLIICMDARLNSEEIAGDSRHLYYIIRTAGSIMSLREEEMLELAVENGIKLIVLTTHTDCAAEKLAKNIIKSKEYPNLTQGIFEREKRIQEFMERPKILQKIKSGQLLVKRAVIDTLTDMVILKE